MGILDFLTGGGIGAIAGAIGGIASKAYDLKMKDKEFEFRKLDQAHELLLRDADMRMAAQEAAARFELGKVDADSRVAVADLSTMAASFESDRATYGGARLGWLVDFVRGVTRPLITYAAMGYGIYAGVTHPELAPQVLFISATAISWWFAARPGKLGDFKKGGA